VRASGAGSLLISAQENWRKTGWAENNCCIHSVIKEGIKKCSSHKMHFLLRGTMRKVYIMYKKLIYWVIWCLNGLRVTFRVQSVVKVSIQVYADVRHPARNRCKLGTLDHADVCTTLLSVLSVSMVSVHPTWCLHRSLRRLCKEAVPCWAKLQDFSPPQQWAARWWGRGWCEGRWRWQRATFCPNK